MSNKRKYAGRLSRLNVFVWRVKPRNVRDRGY